MSSWTNARDAPTSTVMPPIGDIQLIQEWPGPPIDRPWKNTGYTRAPRYTPATTIVAAWINADTGVGPSIASGNQICNGNMADLPAPPIKTRTKPHVSALAPRKEVATAVCSCADDGSVNL